MLFLGKIDITTSFTPRSMQDLPVLIISPVCFSLFILFFVWLFISLEPIYGKTASGWSSWNIGRIPIMIQSLRCSASKNLKVCFPPLTGFWKIFFFILFRWLSPMTQIFFPNLVASEYVQIVFILVVSNVNLWLLLVFSRLLFLSSFTIGMIKWR